MTVKEVLAMLYHPEEVGISWNGDLVSFNFRNAVEVEAWGDFVVGRIYATKEYGFELELAAKPLRKGAGHVHQ